MDQPWPFSDPPNTMAFVSRDFFDTDPICRVYHDWDDGSWQFHPKCDVSAAGINIVCLHHVFDKDATIGELADLPPGWMAERDTPSAPWERRKHHPYPVHEDDGFYLDDATVYQELYPDQYSIPPVEKRKNLQVGERVKLIFRFAAEMAPRQDNECERMWVEVLEVNTDYLDYRGRLLNQPKFHSAISEGDELWFHPTHVFDVDDEG